MVFALTTRYRLFYTEAECNALCAAVKEASWLAKLLQDMTLSNPEDAVEIFEDNTGCLALIQGNTPSRTKHVAISIGFIETRLNQAKLKFFGAHRPQ